MKSKDKLIEESKGYFKAYPNENEVHTVGDGNFFLKKDLSAAKTYAAQQKKDLVKITRDEAGMLPKSDQGTKDKDPVVIPEGLPSKDWTKKQLIAYGAQEFPDLKLTMKMKEDTILTKLAEAAKAKEEADANSKEENQK